MSETQRTARGPGSLLDSARRLEDSQHFDREDSLSRQDTIFLSDAGFVAPQHLTYKELQDQVENLEKGYAEIAGSVAPLSHQHSLQSKSSHWDRRGTLFSQRSSA